MSTNIVLLRPPSIMACAGSGYPRPDSTTRKAPPSWWTPLFGWSSDPDYIDTPPATTTNKHEIQNSKKVPSGSGQKPTRFAPGCFTEEKARMLRMLTVETSSSHDMYHSAIASRLATEFKNRPGFERSDL